MSDHDERMQDYLVTDLHKARELLKESADVFKSINKNLEGNWEDHEEVVDYCSGLAWGAESRIRAFLGEEKKPLRRSRSQDTHFRGHLRGGPMTDTDVVRSDEEILEYFEKVRAGDFLGTVAGDLIPLLSFEKAKPFLKENAKKGGWVVEPRDKKSVIKKMKDYMEFAWDKALGHRGISSGRSIDHFRSWLWLIRDHDLLAFADNDRNYPQYGVPILYAICKEYGFSIPNDPSVDRMKEGESCVVGCDMGCGD